MQERVTTVYGGLDGVVLVAPHGHYLDDSNTAELTLALANLLQVSAVINNDWRRSTVVDDLNSRANCNNYDHCQNPVVYAEFYKPIISFITSQYQNSNSIPLVLMIHGVSDMVRRKANDTVDCIVGFGNGDKPRFTCEESLKDLFIDNCIDNNLNTYAGAKGGDYSARWSKNMTQAIYRVTGANVLQLEIVHSLRKTKKEIDATVTKLIHVIRAVLYHKGNYVKNHTPKEI